MLSKSKSTGAINSESNASLRIVSSLWIKITNASLNQFLSYMKNIIEIEEYKNACRKKNNFLRHYTSNKF